MKASEFRRWLKKRGCTFENHRSGSGHVTVRRDGLVSQLPIARSRQGPTERVLLRRPRRTWTLSRRSKYRFSLMERITMRRVVANAKVIEPFAETQER